MPDVEQDLPNASSPESADPTLQSLRMSCDDTSVGVKALALLLAHSHSLNVVAQSNEGWQGVRQVQQRGGGNDGNEAKVVGDSRGDDEGNAPPNRYQRGVEELARLRRQRGRLQHVHENVVVEDLDTDVAVKTGRDQSCNQRKRVSNSLPGVVGHSLEARVVAVPAKNVNIGVRLVSGSYIGYLLALVLEQENSIRNSNNIGRNVTHVVHEASIHDVNGVNEQLSRPDSLKSHSMVSTCHDLVAASLCACLDKVARASHLRHKLNKQLKSSIGENTREQAIDVSDEIVGGQAGVVHDWRVNTIFVCRDRGQVDGT